MSAEALLLQWSRRESAPAGAAVIAGAEIAARRRRGIEWTVRPAVAVSVLARPRTLEPSAEGVAWAAASLAAAAALDTAAGGHWHCLWPDRVDCEPASSLDIALGTMCLLGPGTIEATILTIRAGPVAFDDSRDRLTGWLLHHLRIEAAGLDDPESALARYRGLCRTLGKPVEVRLLPHGSVKGTAVDVDNSGSLVLASPTGLKDRISASSVADIQYLPD